MFCSPCSPSFWEGAPPLVRIFKYFSTIQLRQWPREAPKAEGARGAKCPPKLEFLGFIAFLCDNFWKLGEQLHPLHPWLRHHWLYLKHTSREGLWNQYSLTSWFWIHSKSILKISVSRLTYKSRHFSHNLLFCQIALRKNVFSVNATGLNWYADEIAHSGYHHY